MTEPNPFEERVVEEAQRIVGASYEQAYSDYCADRDYEEDQQAALAITCMGMACLKGSLYLAEVSDPVMDIAMVGGSTALTAAGLLYLIHNFWELSRRKAS